MPDPSRFPSCWSVVKQRCRRLETAKAAWQAGAMQCRSMKSWAQTSACPDNPFGTPLHRGKGSPFLMGKTPKIMNGDFPPAHWNSYPVSWGYQLISIDGNSWYKKFWWETRWAFYLFRGKGVRHQRWPNEWSGNKGGKPCILTSEVPPPVTHPVAMFFFPLCFSAWFLRRPPQPTALCSFGGGQVLQSYCKDTKCTYFSGCIRAWTFYYCIYTGSITTDDLHYILGRMHGITKFQAAWQRKPCIESSCTAQQSHGVVVAVHRWELTGYNLFSCIQSILLVFYFTASSCDSQVIVG